MLQKYNAKLTKKERVDSDVVLLTLQLTDPAGINFSAGQYILLHVPHPNGETALKHFSIATTPDQKNNIELVAKIIHRGVASTYIESLKIDSTVHFSGPAGRFLLHDTPHSKIFIATGTGIAPIKSIIKSSLNSTLTLFWGLRHFKDLYFFEEFKTLAQENENFNFYICLSQEKDLSPVAEEDRKYFELGRANLVTENLLKQEKLKTENSDFYVCGGRVAVDELVQYLYQKGVNKENIFFEKF
jgi:Na+-transporting NADH:ubiquinone oxidoreductase subunit F